MPLSPRLLRPRASGDTLVGGLDADAVTYLRAVRAADGAFVEPAVQLAISAFIAGCKTDGIWSAIKASCILMGARTLSGALTPLVGSAPTNSNFVSGDYNRKTGLLGDGSTKFLNSNRANNADPQDSQHLALHVSASASQSCAYIGASTAATAGTSAIGRGAPPGFWTGRSRTTTQGISNSDGNVAGFAGVGRSVSGQFELRSAGTPQSFAAASDAPSTVNVFVYVTNGGAAYSNGRHTFYSIGESIDLALLDSRVTTLYTAIGAAIP